MKTWVTVGLVVVVAYVVYLGWFASDDPAEDADKPIQLVEQPPVPPPPIVEEPVAPPSARTDVRLDLGEAQLPAATQAKRDVEAWGLHAAWRGARDDGREKEAEALADRLFQEYPGSDPARLVHFERGREALRRYRQLGRNAEGLRQAQKAREHLTPALFVADVDPAQKKQLRATLAELARAVLLNTRHTEGIDRMYKPKSGDQLGALCRKVFPGWGAKVTPGFLCMVNNLPSPKHLRAGEPIKVPLGEPTIVVVKHEYRLYFLFGGAYLVDFPVGLGKEDSTPETTFEIGDKIKNPDWFPEVGVKIPYGDPRNILGTRWLEFKDTENYRGFGIHGTPDPSTIGQNASSGCIRLSRQDVESLFDWTPSGTKVVILR